MKKLKVFTNHYYPENFKLNELTEGFSHFYDVEVITQTPNYPIGDFFEGYSWFKRVEETLGKIKVKRLPVLPRKTGSINLMLNYLSYIVSSFFYSFLTKDKADHVFVYVTSPIFISWAGLRFAKRNKVASTLYLLDLWPGSLFSILNIENEKIIYVLEKVCIKIYERFDTIVVSSQGFIEVLTEYGIDPSKILYIPQHSDTIEKKRVTKSEKDDKLKIVFTGNIGEAQGLDVLVETAARLKDLKFTEVHFMIVGDGRYRSDLQANIIKTNIEEYFTFTGYVESDQIPDILNNNDFGFVSLQDQDIFNRTLPAKVQSYMANGIPILASANGEVPRLIKEAKCGYSVAAEDSKALASLIIRFNNTEKDTLEIMAEKSYNYSIEHFNKERVVQSFIEVMKEGKKNVQR